MAAFLDRCRFNPTLGGITDWTFASAATGYMSPALCGAVNGRVYKFVAESSDLLQWEICEGAYNSATGVFARTTVLYNSAGTGTATGQSGAGTKISFSAAPQVAIIAVKEDLISIEEANSFTAAQKLQARANIDVNASIETVSTDVNTLVTGGMFFVEASCTNQPVAATQYYLFVQKFPQGPGFVQQMAWDVSAGAMWTRWQASSSWTLWQRVMLDGSMVTYKLSAFTRVLSTASGNQAITGIGFKPRFIQFQTGISGGAGWCSTGQSDGVTNTCLEWALNAGGTLSSFPQSSAGIQRDNAAGSNFCTFTVASLDADGFTLTWTKTGSPAATANITAICYR